MTEGLSWIGSLSFWWQGVRPKTLPLSLCPVLLGSLLAWKELGEIQIGLMLAALFSAALLQAGTNLVNDGMDSLKGADSPARLGPTRVSMLGIVPAQQVFRRGLLFLLLSGCMAIPLMMAGGWPICVFITASLLAGYAYTAGPYPIAYMGGAEFFVLVGFGWGAVAVPFFVQTGYLHSDVWWIGTLFGLLATLPLALNNLRDLEEDRRAHKRTLAVRWGRRFAEWEIGALFVLSWLLSVYWGWKHHSSWTWLSLFFFPLIVRMVSQLRHPKNIPSLFIASLVTYFSFFFYILVIIMNEASV